MRQSVLSLACLLFAVSPALADSTSGTIVAYDRLANIIVLDDKTIWEIVPKDLPLPADLRAGDVIVIDFVSAGDSGVGKINSITRK